LCQKQCQGTYNGKQFHWGQNLNFVFI
jgi:hypothetical protein